MRFPLSLVLVLTGGALAQQEQEVPRALPVDPELQQDPGQAWYERGRNLYEAARKAGDLNTRLAGYERAVEIFQTYLNEFGNHVNAEGAWWYMGQSYYGAGRGEDAKRCFHTILNRYPKGRYVAVAAWSLGVDHYNSRQYALAATYFEKQALAATTPDERQRGWFYAGSSYQMQGRTREAMEYFRKVLEDGEGLNPLSSQARYSLGRMLANSGKLEEAMPLLEAVVSSDSLPELRARAAVQAGAIAAKLGDAAKSEKLYLLVLQTPGMEGLRAEAQTQMMASRYERKDYKGVVDLFERSGEKAAGEMEAKRQMMAGRSLMKLGRNVEALERFREVERLKLPTDQYSFEANYLRLMCFFRIEGRHVPDQVDAFLQLYRTSFPKDAKIHTALLMKAESLLAEKKVVEAAKVYGEIDGSLLSAANRPGLLYHRGWAQFHSEDLEGAIRSFDEFLKAYPEDERVALALLQRADALARTGQPAAALKDYDGLLALSSVEGSLMAEAWIRSADLARQQGQLEEMVKRYRSFLEKVAEPSVTQKAKANYWLAWGLVKTNQVKDSVKYAEEARKLDGKVFGKIAGSLLCLAHWNLQEPESACQELDLAIREGYARDLPEQLVMWAAMQSFNHERFDQAARFYGLIADEEDPEATPKEVWRYLGKSLLGAGEAEKALGPIHHALGAEDDEMRRLDLQLDKAKALFELNRVDESLALVEQSLLKRPQGRVGAGLNELRGDIQGKQEKYGDAAGTYVGIVLFMDDKDPAKPGLLRKLITAMEKSGKSADAERFREELRTKYPQGR